MIANTASSVIHERLVLVVVASWHYLHLENNGSGRLQNWPSMILIVPLKILFIVVVPQVAKYFECGRSS